jgi:type IV secretory pathway TraG/TraD family ATPase VirD4
MEARYGQDAEAMLSQPATKIFLRTTEPRAAKWVSEAIGEIEIERLRKHIMTARARARTSRLTGRPSRLFCLQKSLAWMTFVAF